MNVAAVKIGSTTVSYLLAEELDRPVRREAAVLNLLSRPDAATALAATVKNWLEGGNPRPARVLMAAGQALRERPDLGRALPIPVWTLTGSQEGHLTRLGILASAPKTRGILIDIGGGSTEIVDDAKSYSLRLGVERPVPESTAWPEISHDGGAAIIVGGTGRAASMLLGKKAYEPMSADELVNLQRVVLRYGEAWLHARGISDRRAALIAPGLTILNHILAHYRLRQVYWSGQGLLEGIWLAASLGRGMCWSP